MNTTDHVSDLTDPCRDARNSDITALRARCEQAELDCKRHHEMATHNIKRAEQAERERDEQAKELKAVQDALLARDEDYPVDATTAEIVQRILRERDEARNGLHVLRLHNDQLRADLAIATQSRDNWECATKANDAVVAKLKAELAAAREDSARLDWLLQDDVIRFGHKYADREDIDAARAGGAQQ